jgi:hypothetical protein
MVGDGLNDAPSRMKKPVAKRRSDGATLVPRITMGGRVLLCDPHRAIVAGPMRLTNRADLPRRMLTAGGDNLTKSAI